MPPDEQKDPKIEHIADTSYGLRYILSDMSRAFEGKLSSMELAFTKEIDKNKMELFGLLGDLQSGVDAAKLAATKHEEKIAVIQTDIVLMKEQLVALPKLEKSQAWLIRSIVGFAISIILLVVGFIIKMPSASDIAKSIQQQPAQKTEQIQP